MNAINTENKNIRILKQTDFMLYHLYIHAFCMLFKFF